jgi:hypothetical protein
MFIQMLWLMLVSFGMGIVTGLLIKGIHVSVNQRPPEAPDKYNDTYENEIPPEYQKYVEKNNGIIE